MSEVIQKKRKTLPTISFDEDQPSQPSISSSPDHDPVSVVARGGSASDRYQGRKRAKPHVQGQWPSYVYLSVRVDPELRNLLEQAVRIARRDEDGSKSIHSILPSSTTRRKGKEGDDEEHDVGMLHLSLSRPLMLSTSQRSELVTRLREVTENVQAFKARYATFAVLENDERNTRFLGVEVGYGWDQMNVLTKAIDQVVASLRCEAYYDPPRFHTSIAFVSIKEPSSPGRSKAKEKLDGTPEEGSRGGAESNGVDTVVTLPTGGDDVARRDGLDEQTLKDLNERLGKDLRRVVLEIDEVRCKIGKMVSRFPLRE